jgi:hypothetical protein
MGNRGQSIQRLLKEAERKKRRADKATERKVRREANRVARETDAQNRKQQGRQEQ